MSIEVNNKTRSNIDIVLIKKIVSIFLIKYKKHARLVVANNNYSNIDISIGLVGDVKMRALNKRYRGIDKTTDILSFLGENNFLGELIVNYAQIKRQSKKFKNTPKKELIFILVHGLLHLLNYNDDTDDGIAEMEKLGKNFLDSYNL